MYLSSFIHYHLLVALPTYQHSNGAESLPPYTTPCECDCLIIDPRSVCDLTLSPFPSCAHRQCWLQSCLLRNDSEPGRKQCTFRSRPCCHQEGNFAPEAARGETEAKLPTIPDAHMRSLAARPPFITSAHVPTEWATRPTWRLIAVV